MSNCKAEFIRPFLFISFVLENIGYRVLFALSFEEAVTIWAREKENVDMVVSDLGAITVKGRLFCEIFQKPDLKLLYMSGSPHEEAPSYISSQAFIKKPFRPSELAYLVERAFGERELLVA